LSFFDNFTSFITDRSKRLSARATVIILVLVTVLLADNISGFSYYYNKQRQLDQLKSITELFNDKTLSNETRKKLILLERETLDRLNIIDYSSSFFKKISLISSGKSQTTTNNNNAVNPRNNFWFFVSSSGIYVLIVILTIPVILLADKKTPFFRLIATMIIFALTIAFTAWFNYWLFGIILPDRLFGSWTWNYIANFLLQIGLGLGFFWVNKYKLRT